MNKSHRCSIADALLHTCNLKTYEKKDLELGMGNNKCF